MLRYVHTYIHTYIHTDKKKKRKAHEDVEVMQVCMHDCLNSIKEACIFCSKEDEERDVGSPAKQPRRAKGHVDAMKVKYACMTVGMLRVSFSRYTPLMHRMGKTKDEEEVDM